jgi:hypothetical protein
MVAFFISFPPQGENDCDAFFTSNNHSNLSISKVKRCDSPYFQQKMIYSISLYLPQHPQMAGFACVNAN